MNTIQNEKNSKLNTLETAVLFLVFNRLDTTSQVFEAIKKAKLPALILHWMVLKNLRKMSQLKCKNIRGYTNRFWNGNTTLEWSKWADRIMNDWAKF